MPYTPNATDVTEPVASREVVSAAQEFRTLKSSINTRVNNLTDALAAEAATRAAQDAILQGNIVAGDNALQANINAEATSRAAADSALNVRTTALEQLAFNGSTPGAIVTKEFTATASQTAFTLDFAPISLANIDVHINGVYQHRSTYSVAGAVVTLSAGVAAGDKVEITASVPLQLGTTSAELVEYLPAGTSAVATTVARKLEKIITPEDFGSTGTGSASDFAPAQLSEQGFFADDTDKPNILKLRDRLFVGDGVYSSGSRTQKATESWLTTTLGAHYLERAAQVLSLSSSGKYGGVFASRASDQAKYGMSDETSIGVAAVVINDNTTDSGLGWAGYFEANKISGKGTVFGAEFAIKNKGGNNINSPYYKFGGGGATIGTWFAGGGDAAYFGSPSNPSTCAILIGKNSATWNKGIVFDAEGLSGGAGSSSRGSAIAMAKGHVIEWYSSASNVTLRLTSEIDDANKNIDVIAYNSSFIFGSRSNAKALFEVQNPSNPISYVAVVAKADSSAPQIEARGDAAGIDIRLQPKGSGVVQLGYALAAATTPANFTATHRLTIRDSSGTLYYLPARTSHW